MRDLNQVIRGLSHDVEAHRGAFAAWAEKIKVNPGVELSWGDRMFYLAAELTVKEQYLKFLDGRLNPDFQGDRVATAAEELRRDILNAAEGNPSSTSVSSNLMENSRRVAMAKLLRYLEGRLY